MHTAEEPLAFVARLPSDVLVVIDDRGDVTAVSPSVEAALGYRTDEFRRLSPLELIHPDDRVDAEGEYERLRVRQAGEVSAELRMRHASGQWRWIELLASNAIDPAMGAAVITFRDISDRKEAEAALRQSEERFKALAQNSFDVTLIVGEDLRISYASPSVERVFGYRPDQLEGQLSTDYVHPDDLDTGALNLTDLFARPEEPHGAQMRARHADSSWRWVEATNVNLLDKPGVEGIVVNLRDITPRKQAEDALRASEQRFRAVVLNSLDITGILDVEGRIVWLSPTLRTLLGHDPDAVAGRSALDFVHPDDLDDAVGSLARTVDGDTQVHPITIRAHHVDGSWHPIEAAGAPLQNDQGEIEGVIINLRDVAWRVDAQRALEASEERFKALVRHAPGVVEILSATGEILWVSPAVEELFGYRADDITGTWAGDLAYPDDAVRGAEAFESILDQPGATARVEIRALHADGEPRWIDCVFTNRLDDPSIEGIVGNFQDITERKQAENALRDSEALFRTLAESSPVGIFTIDAHADLVWANERWYEITGLTRSTGLGSAWQAMVDPADRHLLGLDQEQPPQVVEPYNATFRAIRPDGELRWVTVNLSPIDDPTDQGVVAVGTLEDITDRVEAQRDTARLTDIFDATHDVVGIADSGGNLLYINRAARRFFDLAEHGPLDDFNLLDSFPPWVIDRLFNEITPMLERDGIWSGEVALRKADGTVVPVLAQLLVHHDENGDFEFFSGVLRDISDRKQIEEQLAHQATHDPLTGLPNRMLLLDQLTYSLNRARRHDRSVAVLFLDLDHFKVVNDSLGHSLGDLLLVAIADRLKAALRPGDTVARFGGDEFVLLCEHLESPDDVVAIARRVEEAISGSFKIDDSEIYVGVSIGIALSSETTTDPETLIRDADAAMYRAKDKGRARYEIFDSAMRDSAVDRLDIENALRRSLDRHELRVFYQPIIDLSTGRVAGVESLLRWEHAERGLLLPDEFITIAEETGLIVPIGRWVLDQACRQVQRWQASIPDLPELVVTVNLSGRQLGHPDVIGDVERILAETGIDPGQVELEITESVLMDDVEMSDQTLGALRDLGVKLVVDDFGTGYSSLSYLRKFPVDLLKVDQSFVAGLGKDPGDTAIVAAIVNLAHTLGLAAVAEGVETEGQLDELRRMGCDLAQGFHLARPVDGDALGQLLASSPRY